MLRRVVLSLLLVLAVAAVASAAPSADPQVIAKIRVGSAPCASVAAKGLLWVTNYNSSTVSVIDPKTNKVVGKQIPVAPGPCAIVAGAGSSGRTASRRTCSSASTRARAR
jgi:YVTN family beta-propeller protein